MSRAFALALAVLSTTASAAVVAFVPAAPSALSVAPVSAAAAAILPLAPSALSAAPVAAPSLSAAPFAAAPAAVIAVAPVPAPAAAAPLAALAASEQPNPPAAAPAPGGAPKSGEAESAKAAEAFDGTAAAPAAPVAAPAVPAAPLGSGLRMAQPQHDAWLGSVVGLLKGTRTGRRVLRDVDALAARRGRPILLDVAAIGNNGEFRYDSELLVMDAGHLKRDPYQSAPILAHELQHVLQRALELPADALELEIESYTVENRVWSELGVEPDAGSFSRAARAKITADADKFFAWLNKEYKNNIPLHGGTTDAYAARLEKKLEAAKKTEAKTIRKRAAVERVLASMKKNGMPDAAIEAHRRDALEPLDRSLRDGAVNRAWIERDLALLSSPEGRKRFRDYSRGVIRRARALSRS